MEPHESAARFHWRGSWGGRGRNMVPQNRKNKPKMRAQNGATYRAHFGSALGGIVRDYTRVRNAAPFWVHNAAPFWGRISDTWGRILGFGR